MRTRHSALRLAVVSLLAFAVLGCKKATITDEPDYGKPLPLGAKALRKITDPAQLPDLRPAFETRDPALLEALDRSIKWYTARSAPSFYPTNDITFDQAQASAFAFRQVLASSTTPEQFQQTVRAEFDTWMSVGWNDLGDVLFTGYCTPVFKASKTRTEEYRYPLYRKPVDLVIDPVTGKFVGRQMSADRIVSTYPSRAQIEAYPDVLKLTGKEVAWLKDKFEAYIIQVNGSGRLELADGSTLYVGYAGYNGYEYQSIGKMLVADGKISKNQYGLPAIKKYFAEHPADLDTYLNRNDRYVFFQEYTSETWPAGSLGFKVTPLRSLATDKSVFPRAAATLVATQTPGTGTGSAGLRPFSQLMADQDTGGAIRAAGRADIYMGVGPEAEAQAGRQVAEGKLYYFFLKPERVEYWAQRMRTTTAGVVMK